jgi:hypothetical protein
MDLCILLDRISLFESRIKNTIKLSGYKISLIVFVIVVVVDFPFYFWATIYPATLKLNATTSYTLWLYKTSDFTNSELGSVLNDIATGLREKVVTFFCKLYSIWLQFTF